MARSITEVIGDDCVTVLECQLFAADVTRGHFDSRDVTVSNVRYRSASIFGTNLSMITKLLLQMAAIVVLVMIMSHLHMVVWVQIGESTFGSNSLCKALLKLV